MKVKLNNIAIVLHRPRYPENIGAAARIVKNMGIGQLVVVAPSDCDLTRILKMATHNAEDVIARMDIFDELRDALALYQYIVGTTARTGSHRQTIKNPRIMAEELAPITRNNRVAVLFGPEDRGLTNFELKYCQSLVTIPTADFSSINLAQAVMILAYELRMATVEAPKAFEPRLATSRELEGMYDHLQETLKKIDFINSENPDYWMMSVRRFLGRIGLRARETRMIRGICRQIDWYCDRRLRGETPVGSTQE